MAKVDDSCYIKKVALTPLAVAAVRSGVVLAFETTQLGD
jgi:hypothetical protein